MFPLLILVITVLILIHLIPPCQERYHWIKLVGICVRVDKFDADYSIGLSIS